MAQSNAPPGVYPPRGKESGGSLRYIAHQDHACPSPWTYCVGFFGFLTVSQFTVPSPSTYDHHVHLNTSDLSFDNHEAPNLVGLRIKQSKTDPFRQWVDIANYRCNRSCRMPSGCHPTVYLEVRNLQAHSKFRCVILTNFMLIPTVCLGT